MSKQLPPPPPAALMEYLGLEGMLQALREQGAEEAEEDLILDQMDVAWAKLSESEIRHINVYAASCDEQGGPITGTQEELGDATKARAWVTSLVRGTAAL